MKDNILSQLLIKCPFPEVFEDTETVEGCSFPEPRRKIGHIRADYDGWRWYNTVWPCHRALATQKVCKEIDRVYDARTAPDALKDLTMLRKFCGEHADACIAKENKDEFSFYYVGKLCVFWIRLITRKGDYNMYLNAYIKEERYQKYFDFLGLSGKAPSKRRNEYVRCRALPAVGISRAPRFPGKDQYHFDRVDQDL